MASLFEDVASLVNVTDLLIERADSRSSYAGDITDYSPIHEDLDAIVERRSDLIRDSQGEQIQLLADVRISPTITGIQQGDVASWTDYAGAVVRAEVRIVEPWSIGTEDAHIRLRVS